MPTLNFQVVAGLDALLGGVTLLAIPSFYNTIQSAAVLRAVGENGDIQARASVIRDRAFLVVLPLSTFIAMATLLLFMNLGLTKLTISLASLGVALVIAAFIISLYKCARSKNNRGKIKGIGWWKFAFISGLQTVIVSLLIARGAIGFYTLFSDASLALARIHVEVTFQ